jgi:hypothetical protein
MRSEDEVIFGRALDETQAWLEQMGVSRRETALVTAHREQPARSSDSALGLGVFHLHGATFRTLAKWYPEDERIRHALLDWELASLRLDWASRDRLMGF